MLGCCEFYKRAFGYLYSAATSRSFGHGAGFGLEGQFPLCDLTSCNLELVGSRPTSVEPRCVIYSQTQEASRLPG